MTCSVDRHGAMAGTKIIFACQRCGSTFQALQTRKFNVTAKSFSRIVCDKVVYRWHGVYDYVDWQQT